jgi:hypothetical protein
MDNQVEEETFRKSLDGVIFLIGQDMRQRLAKQVIKDWEKQTGEVLPLPVYYLNRWMELQGMN